MSAEALSSALADRYRIERELGAGGMATVYLARDLKHDRDVAIKVLRPELAAVIGAERFLAEIKTTANLQHPHILPLFDSGQVVGEGSSHVSGLTSHLYYVMPFIEGESLRDRLDREKQLPIADAVRIASEVASALDYAHRHGVIHRDIKPENVMLHDGRALVADFGIALAASSAGSRMTETGMSLGTPHYMSPEQAMGERVLDARTDVYALGVVLYEMLTGDPPFTGSTAQAIVAKVMTERPIPPSRVRDTVPDAVEDAVLAAMAKLPADRPASAAAFAAALSVPATGSRARVSRRAAGGPVARFAWPAAALVAFAVAVWGWARPAGESANVVPSRLSISAPGFGTASTALQRQIAISPDGSKLLYVATLDGRMALVRRDLHTDEGAVVPGVPNRLAGITFSPDGREFTGSVVATRTSYRFPIEGGSGEALPREVAFTAEILWADDGTLWVDNLGEAAEGILRVSPTGEVSWPFSGAGTNLIPSVMLPGDRYMLALARPLGSSSGPVVVIDLEKEEIAPLMGTEVVQLRYTSGYLVYATTNGSLSVVPFDPEARAITGIPLTIANDVSLTGVGSAQFDVSDNGTVVYVPEEPRSLVYLDRNGAARLATPERRNFHAPRFSPDGRRISVDFTAADGRDVWLLDRASESLSRLTLARDGHDATWAPDGNSLLYISAPQGILGLYRIEPGRTESAESLFTSTKLGYTGTLLPDGSAVVTVVSEFAPGHVNDIGVLANGGRGPISAIVSTRFSETFPAVSPDGRWLAYASNRTGELEVYVRPLAADAADVQVSTDGGTEPLWGPDGRELFYRGGSIGEPELMRAQLVLGATPRIESRQSLFPMQEFSPATPHANYDISPDGRTFVMVRQNPAARIMVIQNLAALVEKLRGGK